MSAIATAAQHRKQATQLVNLMEAAKVATAERPRRTSPELKPRYEVNGWTAPKPKGILIRRRYRYDC